MTLPETSAVLYIIATFFPHSFSLSDTLMVKIWHRELDAFSAGDVEAAVRHLCRTKDAFPTLKDVVDRLTPPAAMSATEAWRLVTDWAAQCHRGPVFVGGVPRELPVLPPDVAMVAETIGSAHRIATRTYDEEVGMRAHFFRAWVDLEATRRDATARAVVGLPSARASANAAPQALGQLVHLALPEIPNA